MSDKTMKAIAIVKPGNTDVLQFRTMPLPRAGPNDVVVKNQAIAVNPIDYKVRNGSFPKEISEQAPVILGWDGAGVVTAVGSDVTKFREGDEVYYAGDFNRSGSYAEFTAVDERVVAKKPKSLSFAQAAAVPLVALTAWELLVECLKVEQKKSVMIYNGAGGVGSIAIQLAKELGLTVVASASRDETTKWCKKVGADYIVNHRSSTSIKDQLEKAGFKDGLVDYIVHLHDPNNIGDLMKAIKPLGGIALVLPVSPEAMAKIDTMDAFLWRKSIHWTLMFTRLMADVQPEVQGNILAKIAKYYDEGKLKDIKVEEMSWEKIEEAHSLQESGKACGKIVLTVS